MHLFTYIPLLSNKRTSAKTFTMKKAYGNSNTYMYNYAIKQNENTKDNVIDRTMWGSKNICRITVSKYF